MALADYVGLPLIDALIAVDNALRREGLRDDVTLIASGKIATGGEVATHIALGADLVHIGRGFLFSIGCIQAMRCHTNTCPTGVTTQNRWLQSGLDPADKGVRVRNYALALERDLQMITHACGLTHPSQLHRGHVVMNISPASESRSSSCFPIHDPRRRRVRVQAPGSNDRTRYRSMRWPDRVAAAGFIGRVTMTFKDPFLVGARTGQDGPVRSKRVAHCHLASRLNR